MQEVKDLVTDIFLGLILFTILYFSIQNPPVVDLWKFYSFFASGLLLNTLAFVAVLFSCSVYVKQERGSSVFAFLINHRQFSNIRLPFLFNYFLLLGSFYVVWTFQFFIESFSLVEAFLKLLVMVVLFRLLRALKFSFLCLQILFLYWNSEG